MQNKLTGFVAVWKLIQSCRPQSILSATYKQYNTFMNTTN